VGFCNEISNLKFIGQSLQTTTEEFSDTFKDKGDTDIDEYSESSSAADTLIDSSDNEDDIKEETSLTLTTAPTAPTAPNQC
jgi:hypothetical protein